MAYLKNFGVILVGIVACVGLSPVAPELMNPYLFSILMYAGINITLAVSLNLVNGLTGQFSMGHAGFMAVGGYVSAFLTTEYLSKMNPGLPAGLNEIVLFAAALYAGGLASAALGYLVGLPSLRLKGDYLAIVTLGFGEIIRVLILNIDAVGGARGMPGIPKWTNFGWVYAIAFISIITVRRIMASRHGRALLAVREDEIAAEATGVNTTRYKVTAFVIGAFFAGVSGGLFAHFLTYLNPQTFDFNRSFEIIIMVVLGGMGSTTGAVVAALFLTALRELLRPLQEITRLDFRMVIYSLMLVILMLTRPNGFFGTKELSDFGPFRRFKRDALKDAAAADAPAEGARG
ncbi:MAG: branched-chain amino acid ABC transporter permease [Deltaproteobacteria bacterium]|nr:branched-chain amino acid ABC transporter permease [Deltaproteobacteria bacterium]